VTTDLAELEPYQLEGAAFLASRKDAFLADEPGVGKSAQAVRACDLVGARNILVLVPASVRVNWLREFEKFSPLDRAGVSLMDGKAHPGPDGVTVCSYDLLANKKLRQSLAVRQWDVLILDEAHLLKTRTSGRTKAVYGRRCDSVNGLAERAAFRWRLSGTPAPNHVDELWTHLRSAGVWPDNYHNYVATFCTGFTSDFGFRITGTKNAQRLKTLLTDFMLRRKKADVIPTLPPIEFEHRELEPSIVDDEMHFQEFGLNPRNEVHRELAAQNALLAPLRQRDGDAVLDALRQMATSAGTLRKYIGLSKVPAYLDVVRPELRERRYEKILIGAWHTDVLQWLQRELKEFGAILLYGGTPADKRQHMLDKFRGNRTCRVLLCQVKVGIGFNATAAYRVDILEPSWVPAENKQFIDRVHRKGQDGAVTARFFGCGRSVDADITRALANKARELAKVFD
jgi:SNF2 family DNA or RNA helicase